MFEPKIRNSQTDLLMKAILTLESEEDAYRFFEDICTIPEIKSISQRLEVAFVPALHTLGSILVANDNHPIVIHLLGLTLCPFTRQVPRHSSTMPALPSLCGSD